MQCCSILLTIREIVGNIASITLLQPVQPRQYCLKLLTAMQNMGSKTSFNPVILQVHNFWLCAFNWKLTSCFSRATSCYFHCNVLRHLELMSWALAQAKFEIDLIYM